ncbi:MAG: hypothetical protein GOMPHAMPRED_006717 [Gomphillus americanus]|uniref:separase n=1 Tax=Gomphillus americanus TaxID=1940652 RepID=A0A8H3ENR3_9LECA|nr:MAG: hypothetical protein GOMPHAMPRED_006717 [Gomphillus americanus]
MAVASDAESIKAALESPATSTSATVEALTCLLNGATIKKNTTGQLDLENSVTSSRPKASSKPRARSTVNERIRPTSANIVELRPLERVKLATEVVNICLKTLSQAVQTGGQSTKTTSPQKDSPSTEPFTPRSLNIPAKPAKLVKSSNADNKEDGLDSIAECARIALGALRRHNDQSKAQALPELQLELAMSAMVAKLIALEMVDLASMEVRILAKRLDMGNPNNVPSKKPVRSAHRNTASPAPRLVELLRLQHLPDSPSKLSLIFTTQLHVLRLLRFAKVIPDPFDLCKALEPATTSSPSNLLDVLVSIDGKEKCARLLGGLAHAISSISDRISSKIDKAPRSKLDLAHGILQLQVLSLEILSRSWSLIGHNVDIYSQLYRPFKRYAESYLSQSIASAEGRFKIINSMWESFTAITSGLTLPKQQTQDLESARLDINQMLYKLSKATGNHKQSKDLAAKAVSSLSQVEVLGFRKGSLLCQLATVMVKDIVSTSKDEACEALNRALQSYSTVTDGSSEDLDELLVSISNLRKAAATVLARSSPRQGVLKEHHELFCSLQKCVLKSPAFCLRYLGTPSENKTNSTIGIRYAKRKSLALKIGRATIESVTTLARMDVNSTSTEWKSYEQSLTDCHTLQKHLGVDNLATEEESDEKHTPIPILISNVYWVRYLALRQSKDIPMTTLLLENSVKLLQDLSVQHQELGLLPNKLERLAYLQEQSGNWKTASKLYKQLFDCLCQSQLVQIVAEKLRWTPILTSLLDNDRFKLIGKAIDGFCRTKRRIHDLGIQSLCSSELQPVLQGFIQELQLACLKKQYAEAGDIVQPIIEQLGCSLLGIYTEDQFPIRRIRALASLAQCNVHLNSEQGTLGHMQALDDSERTLLPFHDHLIARRNAILAMNHITDSKLLMTSLEQWTRLVKQKTIFNQETLLQRVDDIQEWLNLLSTIVDYTDACGLLEQRVATLDLLTYINRQLLVLDSTALILYTSCLATELVELSSMDQAYSLLLQGKQHLSNTTDVESSTYYWQIAQANFHVKTGDGAAAEAAISVARTCSEKITDSGSKLRSIEIARIQAQYHHASAKHHFVLGKVMKSVYHIKQSVRILIQAWAITERKCGKSNSMDVKSPDEEDHSTLKSIDNDESLASTKIASNSELHKKSTNFWSLIRPLFESLMDASMMFSHAGLISESRYYVLEAVKIAESISAPVLRIRALLMNGTIEIRSGDQATGIRLYELARNILQSCRCLASTQATLLDAECTMCSSQYNNDGNTEKLDEAYALIDKLKSIQSSFLQWQEFDLDEVARKLGTLEISTNKGAKPKVDIAKPSRTIKKAELKSSGDVSINCSQRMDKMSYQQLRSRLLLTKASVLMNSKEFSLAVRTKEEAVCLSRGLQSNLRQMLISTELHLEQGLELLEYDPVLNIIPEAILSQPSAVKPKLPTKTVKQGRTNKKSNPASLVGKHQAEKSDYTIHFDRAFECATTAQSMPPGICSAREAHLVANLRLKNYLALGALGPSPDHVDNATDLVNCLEYGRNYASALGHVTIQADKMLRNTLNGPPSLEPGQIFDTDLPAKDLEHFKNEYMNIIPSNWHVVSISLSEDRSELRLGTFGSQVVPFVLSIPLNRRTIDGAEMEFTFDHGKKELSRIIDLANFSSHEGADLTKKSSKAEWWEARAALDSRLRDLLTNIENIWLGGFRGILRYCPIDADLAGQFEGSFVKTLDKYLPSRQARKGQKKTPVTLDTRVIELFIRLGHPTDDENIDEPILDLLYFVVDILWFNGESNVCDEIDLDAMVLDIRDALTTYHEAIKLIHSGHSGGHTILILDKRLHSFPWESLPCMDGQSVCRLPSLYFLRQQILQMHKESPNSQMCLTIDATDGAYILNPSGDLKSTLSTFQQPLSNLTTWSSSINTEPSESDLATALSTKSLYLYFGHGSGGQYIRSRTIRRLDHCAVALLMGCSSASLTEAGDYESHGTLLNYLHAGSPAVVGTLWDVTDKDIDRLSLTMLQRWGLFGEEKRTNVEEKTASPIKRRTAKGKGKQKDVDRDFSSRVSLDTAIAQARSSCLMRYLNGAAAVVYGIPVCLK